MAKMAIRTRAKATNVLMSPRKVRLVLDLIRDKYHDEAIAILKGIPNRAARVVEKLVKSAAANAENNLGITRDSIKIIGAFADGGPMMKRIQPRAQGRAYRILKRSSHVTVIVEEAAPQIKRKIARTVTKADMRAKRGRTKAAKEAPAAEVTAAVAPQAEPLAEQPVGEQTVPAQVAEEVTSEVEQVAEVAGEAVGAEEAQGQEPEAEQVAEAEAEASEPEDNKEA